MSDDTPTERFPAPEPAGTEQLPSAQGSTEPLNVPRDEPAPTEVLFSPSAPASPPPPPGAQPPTTSRGGLYALIAVGVALLIAVIVVVFMLLNRGDADPTPVQSGTPSPTASPSPSATPSPTPTPTPSETPTEEPEPPAVVGPTFDSFTAQPSAGCVEGETAKPITFSWSSSNAETAYIGVATTNAKSEPYESGLDPVDTFTLDYQCELATQVYTVTIENPDGVTHQTVTIAK